MVARIRHLGHPCPGSHGVIVITVPHLAPIPSHESPVLRGFQGEINNAISYVVMAWRMSRAVGAHPVLTAANTTHRIPTTADPPPGPPETTDTTRTRTPASIVPHPSETICIKTSEGRITPHRCLAWARLRPGRWAWRMK